MNDKLTLLQRTKRCVNLINQARNTSNPFKAKDIKSEVEPLIEPLLIDTVAELDESQAKITDLQHQIARLDERLSNLGG